MCKSDEPRTDSARKQPRARNNPPKPTTKRNTNLRSVTITVSITLSAALAFALIVGRSGSDRNQQDASPTAAGDASTAAGGSIFTIGPITNAGSTTTGAGGWANGGNFFANGPINNQGSGSVNVSIHAPQSTSQPVSTACLDPAMVVDSVFRRLEPADIDEFIPRFVKSSDQFWLQALSALVEEKLDNAHRLINAEAALPLPSRNDAAVELIRRYVAMRESRFIEARKHLERAQMSEFRVPAMLWLGRVTSELDDHSAAIDAYSNVIRLVSGTQAPWSDLRHISALINRGVAFTRLGIVDSARDDWQRAIKLAQAHEWPGSVQKELALAHANLGAIATTLAGAEKTLREATRLDDACAVAWYNLACVTKRAERRGEAVEAFEKCLNRDPTYVDGLRELGRLLLADGLPVAAEEQFSRALRFRPESGELRHLLGRALFAAGDHVAAIAEYELALGCPTPTADLLVDLAVARVDVYLSMAVPDKQLLHAAEHELIVARSIDSDRPDIWANLGNVAYWRGEMEIANQHYERAVELGPCDARNWINVASTRDRLGYCAAAQDAIERAAEISGPPEIADFLQQRVCCC